VASLRARQRSPSCKPGTTLPYRATTDSATLAASAQTRWPQARGHRTNSRPGQIEWRFDQPGKAACHGLKRSDRIRPRRQTAAQRVPTAARQSRRRPADSSGPCSQRSPTLRGQAAPILSGQKPRASFLAELMAGQRLAEHPAPSRGRGFTCIGQVRMYKIPSPRRGPSHILRRCAAQPIDHR